MLRFENDGTRLGHWGRGIQNKGFRPWEIEAEDQRAGDDSGEEQWRVTLVWGRGAWSYHIHKGENESRRPSLGERRKWGAPQTYHILWRSGDFAINP